MLEAVQIHMMYLGANGRKSVSFSYSQKNEDLCVDIKWNSHQDGMRLSVIIEPLKPLEVEAIYFEIPYTFTSDSSIFVNGYQSWTDSREFFPKERMKGISKIAGPVMKKYQFDKYGDYQFVQYSGKPGVFHGYTYGYVRKQEELLLIGSLSEASGFTRLVTNVSENLIRVEKDCKGLQIETRYNAFDMFFVRGHEADCFDSYFEAMGVKKPSGKPMNGWTSWYNYYQNISEAVILENLKNISDTQTPIGIFQIDDGYQTAVGDWLSVDKAKFPNGMKLLADKIKAEGSLAGIWLAPFVCETDSRLYAEKPEWLLKDACGEAVMAGSNWSGFYALDFYNKEVQAYIKEVFDIVLNHWGYDMVKLDFLYAVCMLPRADKTRGQIMTEAMQFLRDCVGDKLILGCGVPLGPAFGLVDYCRIGCDVGLDWDDKFYMKYLHRERVSTRNALINAMGRHHLDGRAFLNDPDVFLLRDDNLALSKTEKMTLAMVNQLCGSLIFTSDNVGHYNAAQSAVYNDVMCLKDRRITKKYFHKNGLAEIYYQEHGESKRLAVNLSDKVVYCELTSQAIEPHGCRLTRL